MEKLSCVIDESRATTFEKLRSIYEIGGTILNSSSLTSTKDKLTIDLDEGDVEDCYFEPMVTIDCGSDYSFVSNCVFTKPVNIRLNESDSRIELDNCVFKQKVMIFYHGGHVNNTQVVIRSCRANHICFNHRIEDLELSNNVVYELDLQTTMGYVFMYSNTIYQVRPLERISDREEVSFYDNDFKEIFTIKELSEAEIEEKLLNVKCKKDLKEISNGSDIHKKFFYDAILTKSDVKYNRNKYAEYLYKKRLASASNVGAKVLLHITKGFCYPMLFIIYLIAITLFFGCLYFHLAPDESLGSDIVNCMYYSGITITTLGYTEVINPIGGAIKILSVVESFLGVLLASCLLTSIINKYVD